MFFLKQLGSLLNAVKEIDPDANPSVMIKFMLPNGTDAKAVYVHNSFDGEGDSQGSIVLYYGDNKTEFDSLQYTLDGINSLCGSTDTNTSAPNNVDTLSADKLADNLGTMSADELAGDLVTYLYDKYKGAAYIGEKELNNGAIALRFEWGSDFKDIEQDLTARYGDRITFIRTRSQYAPEQTASGILVSPPKAAQAVTESIATDKFELVENFPIWAIEPLVNDSWGDYLQYNGEELAREDFSDIDNFMTTHGYCGIHAPSDELYDQTHSGFTSHPAFGKSTDTCSVYAVKGPWKSLMKEYGLETAAPVTESVDSSDSAMYTIEPADDADGPNDLYIELPASKGWTLDDAEAFAEILKDSAPNSADVFYMGSYAEGGTFFQIYIDQKEVRPMTSDEWAPTIKEAINEIYGDNSESGDIERSVGDSIDTAMMDHYDMMNGDIGDIFESSVKTLCDKAGKPALAEAVIKLFNVYKPVMEAGEAKRHRIPRYVADEANNIIAKNVGWSDELKAKEFEETWDWMERYADAFIPAWNKTDSVEAGIEAIYDAEEHQQCMFDGI